jgi:type IV pilus biogenesis protein CpaD/CtpE
MKVCPINSIFLVSITLLAIGCASTQQFSQAQLNAIETREVEASMNETYNAASGALFDAGYSIAMSDRQGGLLTGTKALDRSAERFWVSPYIEDTRFALSIQVRETTRKNCTVRIKTSINGAPKVDKKAIDQLWILMQSCTV